MERQHERGQAPRDRLGLARNPHDRTGHFAQGRVPAILVREILLRASPRVPGGRLAPALRVRLHERQLGALVPPGRQPRVK
jgi:hypothetical protein